MDAPVLGADASPYYDAGQWVASVSWRYQKSFRHFVGSEEQTNRNDESSEVINHIHLFDVAVRYQATKRLSLTLSVPYLIAERSQALRNSQRQFLGRASTHASGLSDVSFVGRYWLLDPEKHDNGNVSLGLGLKLPTGNDSVQDTRASISNNQQVLTVQTVDQSIQPGDGGFGVVLDLQAFQRITSSVAGYLSAAYLFNPRGVNDVYTYRGRASEAIMSVADQYVARAGVGAGVPWVKRLGVSLGVRLEGVPAHDAIGPSEGFRRPGYVWSIDPGVSYQTKHGAVGVAVPFALYRNRTVSFSDELDHTHGDAAFADYIVFVGYTHRF